MERTQILNGGGCTERMDGVRQEKTTGAFVWKSGAGITRYTAGMDGVSFNLVGLRLPARLRLAEPMSDGELLEFSAANDALRMEREPNGELTLMTPTGARTGKINFKLCALLAVWAEADVRGYGFDSNTGFRLPDGSMRSPDASWLVKERWDALSNEEQDGYAPVCPEFVVELTSPTDRLPAVRRKMERVWMPNGVEVGWLIDPGKRTVRIYRAGQEAEELVDPTSVQGTGPVRGFELVMSRVWD